MENNQTEKAVERGGLSQGETLPLGLLVQRPSALDSRLLLLELESVPIELLLHLAVAGVQLFFALLELGLLLGHLLLEDHLHLGFHLGELLLVQGALLFLLDGGVDLLEDAGVLGDTHGDELVRSVVLVQVVVGVLLELLHVGTDEHLAELDEVAVLLVIDLNHTPRVATATDLAPVGICDLVVGTNDGERDLGKDLVVLRDGLVIIELVPGTLEDLDLVVLDVGEDLGDVSRQFSGQMREKERETYPALELGNLLVGEGIGLGDDGDQVDLGVEALHDFNVQRLEGVAGGLDEEHAGVDAVVNNVHAIDLVLGIQVGIKALLDVVHDGAPRLVVVDEVTETGRVDHGEAEANASLLDIGADGLDGDRLGDDVEAGSLALLGRVERGVEQGVHEGGLSEARLACRIPIVLTSSILSCRARGGREGY